MSGASTNAAIISAAKQAGVDYVFVVNAAGQISVAVINANLGSETAKVSLSGSISSPLGAAKMAVDIVDFILNAGPKPPPGYVKPVAEKKERVVTDGRYSHSIGTSAGIPYGGAETYWRAGMAKHCRFYTGFGVWSGNRDGGRGYTYYEGNEFQLAAFVEWHTNNHWFNIYFGPGVMFGLYNYTAYYQDYRDWYTTNSSESFGTSFGASVGVQSGLELKLGWFLLGANARAALYVRSWDSGVTGSFGAHTGVAF
jgi:hypothetical protein